MAFRSGHGKGMDERGGLCLHVLQQDQPVALALSFVPTPPPLFVSLGPIHFHLDDLRRLLATK